MLNSFVYRITVLTRLLKYMDWEYIIPYLFIQAKYKDSLSKKLALNHINLAYIERRFKNILNKYKTNSIEPKCNDGPIWVCWMQGEKSMPEVVQTCYSQLHKMAPSNRKIILLTWENIRQYTDIPEYIYEKLQNGIMTYTHFSDIVRFSVLSLHGGLWVDSTVYVSSPIPESIFSQTYFSIRTHYNTESDFKYNGVNRCLWKCFILGASAGSTWFRCAKEIIYDYWENNNYLLAYMLVDYILLTIYDCIGHVKQNVDLGVELAEHLYELEKRANEPYDASIYHNMSSSCRWFKLSYKLPFKTHTQKGEITYFGQLIHSES